MPRVELDLTSGSILRWLLLCGVLAPAFMVGFVVASALMTSDHSYLSATVSQLGTSGREYASVMNSGFVLCGVLVIPFAYGLYCRLGRNYAAKALWILLTVDGIGTILIGMFHADSVLLGGTATFEGDLHGIFAGIAYLALVIGMVVFAVAVHRRPEWRGFMQASAVAVVINSAILLVFFLGFYEAFEGGLQLAFFGTAMLWMEAVAVRSLRQTAQAHEYDTF